MPILRRKINKAASDLTKAKRSNTTQKIPNSNRVMLDSKGLQREMTARDKYKKAMEDRKEGVVGYARKKVASTKAKDHLQNQKHIKALREKGYEIKKPQPKKELERFPLGAHHPLLKGIFMTDSVRIVSNRGNERIGKITGVGGNLVILDIKGKTTPLNLNQLKSIKPI